MIVTPLIQKIKGGTLITFQSAYEDMNLNITTTTERKFKFSNFALLNLPPIAPTTYGQNVITPTNIEGKAVQGSAIGTSPLDADIIDFSESIQNYLLNLESLLLSREEYSRAEARTVSQRVFFKWLKELGAIRFAPAPPVIENNSGKFVEEDNSDSYSRVVQYIGHIDMVGSNYASSSSATELYLHVPSMNGNTPIILFKSVEDSNYHPGMIITKPSGNVEFINGRDTTTTGVKSGVSTQAIYDGDLPEGSFSYTTTPPNSWWIGNRASVRTNAYYTDTVFGDPTTVSITRSREGVSNTYSRSNLDGIELDLDINSYVTVNTNDTPQSFNDLNSSGSSTGFEYNVVALFYDILDNTGEVLATNLYGFVILEDIVPAGTGISAISGTKKYKSSIVTGDQGNGIGIRVNIKLANDVRTVLPIYEVSVNDYNTFSMELFENSIRELITLNKNCNTLIQDNIRLAKDNDTLRNIVAEYMIKNNELSSSNATLQATINDYLLGTGISTHLAKVDRVISDSKTIISTLTPTPMEVLQNHYTTFIVEDTLPGLSTNVVPANSRYVIHDNGGIQIVGSTPLIITIDTTTTGMIHNQVLEILFKDKIKLRNTTVEIYVKYQDAMKMDATRLIYTKAYADLSPVDNINIICLNPITHEYYCY